MINPLHRHLYATEFSLISRCLHAKFRQYTQCRFNTSRVTAYGLEINAALRSFTRRTQSIRLLLFISVSLLHFVSRRPFRSMFTEMQPLTATGYRHASAAAVSTEPAWHRDHVQPTISQWARINVGRQVILIAMGTRRKLVILITKYLPHDPLLNIGWPYHSLND
jgi:hypothetical protein